jgi:hypothetical protein
VRWPTELLQERFVPSLTVIFSRALLGIAIACIAASPAIAADNTSSSSGAPAAASSPEASQPARATGTARANFKFEAASPQAQELGQWVVHSGDNRKLPFIIIDKVEAKVFVFDPDGQLRGASPALLGLAIGDDSVPGIGQRKLSTIRPDERTTPAGRFVASLDRDLHGEEVLWVDYDTAVSLHPVVAGHPKERRAQRLASPSPLDNRISYGCINVPVAFYKTVVSPAFKGTEGIVYVLPETRSARQVFGSYAVEDHAGLQAPAPAFSPSGN